eukprot:5897751-Prymnesium_polylepis.1
MQPHEGPLGIGCDGALGPRPRPLPRPPRPPARCSSCTRPAVPCSSSDSCSRRAPPGELSS